MSDFKSKLPDFQELTSMTGKLFKGIKSSVEDIIHDYKEKRAHAEETEAPVTAAKETKAAPETTVEANKSDKE